MKYNLFTDGSSLGNPGPSGWAGYIVEARELVSGELPWATNSEAEMMAILQSIAKIPDGEQVVVNTDSKLMIGWLAMNYKTKSNPKIGDYRAAIFQLVEAKHLGVFLKKVKGHNSDQYNEKVDREARRKATLARETGFADLSISEDKGFVRLLVDVRGASADQVLRGIENAGGICSGLFEVWTVNACDELEITRTHQLEDGKYV